MTIRIDIDTATRDDLIGEIHRLNEVNRTWASSWQQIIAANAAGWSEQVAYLADRVETLERLL